ncbi:MAG: hypothetical protein PHH14_05125 [Candidatus Margulisbacteria bacterium]|nr:hypothetical protein [Candidatus Margulisiibacteriota bacterium]
MPFQVDPHSLVYEGYKPHSQINGARLAKTFSADGLRRIGHDKVADTSFVDVPRWMVWKADENFYRETILGYSVDPKSLSPEEKLEILRHTNRGAADSGVAFVGLFQHFSRRHKLDRFNDSRYWTNPTDLQTTFTASGIVQKCGTRDAFERLFNLIKFDPNSHIKTENDPTNEEAVNITIIGDLFSAAFFQAMIAPEQTSDGQMIRPQIIVGTDIGWDFAPHNLIVTILEPHLKINKGMHVYHANIEGVSRLQTTRLSNGNLYEPTDTENNAIAALKRNARLLTNSI